MINYLLHILYPEICLGCGNVLSQVGAMLCNSCRSQMPRTHFFEKTVNPIAERFYGRVHFEHVASAFYYDKDSIVQRLVYEFKYAKNEVAALLAGKLMLEEMQQSSWINDIDAILPVPLSPKRKHWRGFNQAERIAQPIAEHWKIPLWTTAVGRIVHTETQTHKTREERWESMQNVFATIAPQSLQGKHILLVDDIITTGATIETLALEILKNAKIKISIASFAAAF